MSNQLRMLLASATAMLFCVAFSLPAVAVPDVQVLAVGSNQSYVKTLKDLRFAEADAKRFANAMQTVGLVPSVRATVLTDATVKDFRDAFRQLVAQDKQDAKDGPSARKFVFYYSGHSDDKGLHLKDGLISKSELHDELSSLSAHTKVAILDSCFSGAISAKGVESAPAFELPRVEFDEPSGSVFLTASTGRQLAYESDDLGSSVFTHHLLNGLYGEADGNADGVVTVDELYQYVYQNTKWQTLNYPTRSAQEPEYLSELKGQGAIVLSFPAKTNSKLALDANLKGEITIASPRGIQFFKVQKIEGQEKTVQLPVGAYQLYVRDGDRIGEGQVKIETARLAHLAANDVKWRDADDDVEVAGGAKGNDLTAEKVAPAPPSASRFGMLLGTHSGFLEDQPKGGPFVEVNYQRTMLKFRFFEMAFGAALNFHRNEIKGDGEVPQDIETLDDPSTPASEPETSKEPEQRTDSTAGFGTLSLQGRAWLIPVLFGVELGIGQAYHDQRLAYGTVKQGGTVPATFSGLRLEYETTTGHRYGLVYRQEFMQTVGVSDASTSARGQMAALSATF